MSREIKFRGLRKCRNRWCYGGISIFENEATIFDCNCIVNSAYEVEINSIGQFTGLVDKNGVDIYEGDIVKNWDTNYTVKYELYGNMQGFSIDSDDSDLEIIGNIYENPELL